MVLTLSKEEELLSLCLSELGENRSPDPHAGGPGAPYILVPRYRVVGRYNTVATLACSHTCIIIVAPDTDRTPPAYASNALLCHTRMVSGMEETSPIVLAPCRLTPYPVTDGIRCSFDLRPEQTSLRDNLHAAKIPMPDQHHSAAPSLHTDNPKG